MRKTEFRNPKEIRMPKPEWIVGLRPTFGFRISGFSRISGIRISEFALAHSDRCPSASNP
jgi:hypothetical protein